jgi:hypothetical protein
MSPLSVQTFFPTSRTSFTPVFAAGKRYRNTFNDKRLSNRHTELVESLIEKGKWQIKQISSHRNQEVAFGRFLSNDSVELSEVVRENTKLGGKGIKGADLMLLLDISNINLSLNGKGRKAWKKLVGVIGTKNTPGLFILPCLVIDRHTYDCIGIGDIVFFSHPPAHPNDKKNKQLRNARRRLPLEHKETGSWLIAARNTIAQLGEAASTTVVMDQGGDVYDLFAAITHELKADFIVRAKYDRMGIDVHSHRVGKLSDLLSDQEWQGHRIMSIRALDHFSKSHAKRVKRKKRKAMLNIRYTQVVLKLPDSPSSHAKHFVTLSVVEIKEDPSTVPEGEKPIHWTILTSHDVKTLEQAWQIAKDYAGRWHIEQLFRVLKKDGFDIEKSQLQHPDNIKKLLVMTLKASAEVMRLVNARDGEPAIDISDVFSDKQQQVLHKLNATLEGNTEKLSNPHLPNTLAYAVWVISRLGSWMGYASQRPPGPKIIKRGLEAFYAACRHAEIFQDT